MTGVMPGTRGRGAERDGVNHYLWPLDGAGRKAGGGAAHRRMGTSRTLGEPDASKGACPVREGLSGNVITTVRMWITRAGLLLHDEGTWFNSRRGYNTAFKAHGVPAVATGQIPHAHTSSS